jgi:hypothetical protein
MDRHKGLHGIGVHTVFFALVAAVPAFSQGNPTGTISGHIVDASGGALPGVTVTAGSPALQGVHVTTSTQNGDYLLPFLAAGDYSITFELQGFRTVKVQQGVAAAQTYPVNMTLAISPINETVEVVGKAESISPTATAATSLKADLVGMLPTNRTLDSTVLLTPGVKNTGAGQTITMQGALSFESLFLVNGVVVNENLRGQSTPVYIEDALQETTVMTSGVSAEYGRFSGGVANAITKSGGNLFSGSFRDGFTNDSWRTLTPYPNDTKVDKTVPVYEFTGGGPIAKDRLWFFAAGRLTDASNANTGITTATNIPYPYGITDKRMEGKLTYSPNAGNTFRGSYSRVWETDVNNWYTSAPIMDLASLYTRTVPEDLLSLNYTSIIKPNLFVEAQFSQRRLTFSGSGSQYTDIIKGTLLVDQSRNARFWSPTFCGVCSDEHRDNQNIIVKGTYFLSNGSGSHRMLFGFDNFRDKRLANNHQSGSDYRIYASSSIVDANNTLFPVFDNGQTTYIQYQPIPLNSVGNDFQTYSAFYNDSWQPSRRLGVNLGVRWDHNRGNDQTGATVVNDSAFSPRLGLTIDLAGDGKWVASASYARYVTSIANNVGDSGSSAGNPAAYIWYYGGPAINVTGPVTPTAQAIQQVFSWFNANGGPSTTTLPLILASVPGVNTHVGSNLTSPSANEVAGGITRQLGGRGALRADVTYRKYRDFYSDRVDQTTGQVTDSLGKKFDLQVIENTNDVQRQYAGLNLQGSYIVRGTTLGGNYTLSRAWGNFNGETATSGASEATPHFYPEYTVAAWNLPTGDLTLDQRHRARMWVNYALPVTQSFGTLDVSVLEQLGSGSPYGAVGTVNSSLNVPASVNATYQTPMGGTGVPYYFTARDAFHTAGEKRTDLALNYGHKLGVRKARVFAQAQVLNVFNQFQLYNIAQINTTVLTRVTTKSYQAFNVFTDTPVLGTNWNYGPLFGQALSKTAYTTPRTFRFSVGFTF